MLPTYTAAISGEKNTVIYIADDGSQYLHSGGSRAWRNNNPGNVRTSDRSGLKIGEAGGFSVYPSHKVGWAALKYVLKNFYSDKKLGSVFHKYAPAKDENNPEYYSKLVNKFTGLDSDRLLSDLNDDELDSFMKAIQRVEGWIEGVVEEVPFARQFEIQGPTGKPLSGIDYVINFFTSSGDKKVIKGKTDDSGKTKIAKTNTKSPVTLHLPRPNPGESFKGKGEINAGKAASKVVAGEANATPWHAFAFERAKPSTDPKDKVATTANLKQEPPKPPTAKVQQKGAIKASSTVEKSKHHVEKVTKEPGVFVTWIFDTKKGSGKNLQKLPYCIALIDGGSSVPLFEEHQVKLMLNQKIRHKIPFGKDVVLYLGNDAKRQYRKYPLYRVTADESKSEIVVTVYELKKSKAVAYDKSKETPLLVEEKDGKLYYTANLYGNTWFNFSHKFTIDEAKALTLDASSAVSKVVENIYAGEPKLVGNQIIMTVTTPSDKLLKIVWPSSSFGNCLQNIEGVTMANAVSELVPRVNPNTYQAFITAAFQVNAEEIVISSGWRPMLGSVLHRIGVGLDVGSIKVHGQSGKYSRSKTPQEIEYQTDYQRISVLGKKHNLSDEEQLELNKLKSNLPKKADKVTDAIKKSEADFLLEFTNKLRENSEVYQTFDPWVMELDASDKVAPVQNKGNSGNDKLHLTHLHITVFDPELGFGS